MHCFIPPPLLCPRKIVWVLDKLCKGFCKFYSPLRQMKITKTNDSILRTDNLTYVLALFFASFEILSQGKFSHFCLLWEGLCCGRMCLCNRTTMPWFPPNLKFSFTLRGASSKFQHFLKLLVPTFLQLNKSILFSLFFFKIGFGF